MVHKNCFINDNKFIWIDQEWCLHDIPASFILFYNICELYISNTWINSIIKYNDILKHYNIDKNKECYINIRTTFFNTVLNPYTINNYNYLSTFNDNNINDNINYLTNKIKKDNKTISNIKNETINNINGIIQNQSLNDMIIYVNTLTNNTIISDIPAMPEFIVLYLNSSEADKEYLNTNIRNYDDIIAFINKQH